MTDKTEDGNKYPKPVKIKESKWGTSPIFKYFQMTPIKSGDRPLPTKEEMHDQLVKQMTDMDEKEIKNMANIIVNLIMQVRELSDSK